MAIVRVDRPKKDIGPRQIVQQIASLLIESGPGGHILKAVTSITPNVAPRAGEVWKLQGLYFEFPSAFKNSVGLPPVPVCEFEFTIKLLVGGVVVARQTFLATSTKNVKEKWALVGNLEAFFSNTVNPGQSITVECELTFAGIVEEKIEEEPLGEAQTGKGKVVVTYMQTGY